ncbi:LysE family transporter [Chryseolinea sp. T2]|uniref:LysE family transporter n=1 Tax=Chryseolinea sp. T2 TaxID=3129255 RepID=UPI003077B694
MRSNLSVIKFFTGLVNQQSATRIDNPRLFCIAVLLSFLGSLPPGTTNLMTIRLATESGAASAVWFSVGCLLAELVAVSASLILVDRMLRFKNMANVLQWTSLVVLFIFALGCFIAAFSVHQQPDTMIVDDASPLILGFVIMIVNPVQLPFWLGWTAILADKKIIKAVGVQYIMYVVGSGVGSFLASGCFILLGTFFVSKWSVSPMIFYIVLGILFLLSFALQIRKMYDRDRGTTIKT